MDDFDSDPTNTARGFSNFGNLIGDYNADGRVDLADYTVWRDNLGRSVLAGTVADGDGNRVIDAADYAVWRQHLGQSQFQSATTVTVPEPAGSVALLLTAFLALLILSALRRNSLLVLPLCVWHRAGKSLTISAVATMERW